MLYGHDEGKNIRQLCNGEKDVVCIKMGGTGADTAAGARNNIFEGKPLSIKEGGTGATTLATAQDNLGITKLMNVIGANVPASQSLTNSLAKVTLEQTLKNGSLFTFSNSEITCVESGVVEVNLIGYFANGFTEGDLINLACYKNGTLATRLMERVNMAGAYQFFTKTDYIEVSAGDKLTLYARNADGARGVILDETRLLVRYTA